MIECTNIDMQDLLPEFIAERLSARERELVALHLADCAACQADHEVLVAVRHARPVPPPVNIASIVAALPRPFVIERSTPDELSAAGSEHANARPMLTVQRGGDMSRHASPPSVSAIGTRSRSRRMTGMVMRFAAAFTLVAVGGLSMVMARRTPTQLTDMSEPQAVFSNEAPMELANIDLPYAPGRVPVRAVVSVAQSVLPIQELSDYSDDELALLMQQLEEWDGAPPVDSISLAPSGIDSAIQGAS